jgi:hypothetical protein
MDSPFTRFTMVVFPALSKPTINTRSSRSFALTCERARESSDGESTNERTGAARATTRRRTRVAHLFYDAQESHLARADASAVNRARACATDEWARFVAELIH